MPKVTVLLDSAEFERLASYCRAQGFKKSTLIARLVREHLDNAGHGLQGEFPLTVTSRERRPRPEGP